MITNNKTSEQIARDQIDKRLNESGWAIQNKNALDFNASRGIAVREYQTDIGPADYVLFVDRQAVGALLIVQHFSWPGQTRSPAKTIRPSVRKLRMIA